MPVTATKSARSSRHETVIGEFRERISREEWKPGQRLPSFGELRAEYGLAPSTVDRIYAVLEQEGLVVREQGKGIFVAPPRVNRPKGIIGLRVPQDREVRRFPYWIHLLDGVHSVVHESGFEVLILGLSTPAWEKMDGILVHQDDADDLLRNRPSVMPAVTVMTPSAVVPSVVADDYGGTKEAVQHLISLGHERIGCMMFVGTPIPERRLAGYYAALATAGITPRPEWMRPLQFGPSRMSLRDLGAWNMRHWLAQGWAESGCTAVLVQNDPIARGVLGAFREAGISVPGQVSVVGFDGAEEPEEARANLTSVHVPLFRIGATAAKMLLNQINGSVDGAHVVALPAHFRAGETTGPAPK